VTRHRGWCRHVGVPGVPGRRTRRDGVPPGGVASLGHARGVGAPVVWDGLGAGRLRGRSRGHARAVGHRRRGRGQCARGGAHAKGDGAIERQPPSRLHSTDQRKAARLSGMVGMPSMTEPDPPHDAGSSASTRCRTSPSRASGDYRAVASMSLMRLSWLTSEAPGS
jgi:hypothetical protein